MPTLYYDFTYYILPTHVCYAPVLFTGPDVCPSIRSCVSLSVCPVQVLSSKTKRRRKQKLKLVLTFSRAGVTGVPIFQFKMSKGRIGGRPRDMSTLGRRSCV